MGYTVWGSVQGIDARVRGTIAGSHPVCVHVGYSIGCTTTRVRDEWFSIWRRPGTSAEHISRRRINILPSNLADFPKTFF